MGRSGSIGLTNGTPYIWRLHRQASMQMAKWSPPDVISPGSSKPLLLEYAFEPSDTSTRNFLWRTAVPRAWGKAVYCLEGTENSFTVDASCDRIGLYPVKVTLDNFNTRKEPRGHGLIRLGDLSMDGLNRFQFFLSGQESDYCSSSEQYGWMHINLKTLGPRTLRQLCLPASHASGMSRMEDPNYYLRRETVATQDKSILAQLGAGCRYFDIQVILDNGRFRSAHGDVLDVLGWVGAYGQSILEMINDVNAFTPNHGELIILWLSHMKSKQRDFARLNQEELNLLLELVNSKLNNLFTISKGTEDLSSIPLSTFIGTYKSAVLVIVDNGETYIPEALDQRGFYRPSQLLPNLAKIYLERNLLKADADEMARGATREVYEIQAEDPDCYRWLQWVVEKEEVDLIGAFVGGDMLRRFWEITEPLLYDHVLSGCTPRSFPNVISTDFTNENVAALCMAINDYIAYADSRLDR